MKALVENLTDHPTRELKKPILFVLRELEVDERSLLVRVKEGRGFVHSGRFYPDARAHWAKVWKDDQNEWREIRVKLPADRKHLIIARIPKVTFGIANRIKRGGPPPIDPENWIESLVCITAHEAMHFRQFLYPKKPKWSEVEAEWAEYRLLKGWREKGRS